MMDTIHTPGPWRAKNYLVLANIEDDGRGYDNPDFIVGYAATCDDLENALIPAKTMKANAQLMAAAPELLQALKDVLEDEALYCLRIKAGECTKRSCLVNGGYTGSGGFDPNIASCAVFRAEAAVAKAEGKAE